ncbi:MAG TPA: putative LPS assembly protein LptD [Candidatus Limnocylindria bacterium]|nr:putative LPS assembly protein LptD [Candidatus Limnocylindria bacterium]
MSRLVPVLALAAALAMPAFAQESSPQEPAPPLNISADNVTGSRGAEGDVVLLNGNVRITRGRTVITAARGRYLRAQGMLFLDQNVRMVDGTTTLTCDHASYSEDSDILQVTGNVVVVDRDATLRAPSGTYDRRTGRADLYGGVEGRDERQRLTGDQVAYLRDSLLVRARGNVRGVDEENRLELRGAAIDYDRRSHEAVATGDPVLESRDERGRITAIRANTLKLNTESRLAEAIDSVRVSRDTLQARSDYALFDDRADRAWLLGHPRAWDNETTVTGDTLEVWTEERALRRFVVRGNAIIDYRGARPTTLGEASRLTGDRVDVFFTNENIDSLVALGQARNEYQAVPRPDKTPESNRAEGDTITVFFKERKIHRAVVQGTASGTYQFAVASGDTAAAKQEIVEYDAPRIEFVVPEDRIVLEPRSHLRYRELELRAKRVEFDSERQTLVATGDPELIDRGDKVSGHLMTYDLESRTGTIYQAETTYEKGLYHGERIRKVGENVLDVLHGSYSTCDRDPPHYHFQANLMKIFLKDKLVAKPVVFYIKNVPLLALPFYIFPIRPGRHSGFLFPQVEFGFNNQAGQFVRNAGYYWAPNDYLDATFSGDYYQAEPSWILRGEGRYHLLYVLNGQFISTFAHSELDQRDRWDLVADHAQDISPRTRLIARASYVSSRDYRRDQSFGIPLSQRLDRFLTSAFTVTHNAEWAAFNAVVDRRQDLDADQSISDPDGEGPLEGPPPGRVASVPNLTETVPNLSISFPTRTLGTIGPLRGTTLGRALSSMYFSLNTRFLAQRERTAFVSGIRTFMRDSVLDTTTVIGQRNVVRTGAAGTSSLTDSRRLFGWLNLAAGVNGNGAVFDRDQLGNRVVPTGTWNSSLTTSTTFYGTFRPNLGSLASVRHVVFPSVSFNYSPEFRHLTFVDSLGVRRERFQSFGGIGVSGFRNARANFLLDQRLQVKWRRGEKIERLDNLVSFATSGSYNFLYRDQNQEHPLSNLSSTLRLQPPGLLSLDAGWITDVYSQRPLRSFNYSVGANLSQSRAAREAAPDLPLEQRATDDVDFTEPWTLGLAYSYSGGYSFGPDWQSTETANGVFHVGLSRAWRLDYSASYDVSGRQVLTQRFGLTRDLHCWQASFTRTFSFGGEAEYYFRLAIKDQKEIYLERGSRFGSFGGIQ